MKVDECILVGGIARLQVFGPTELNFLQTPFWRPMERKKCPFKIGDRVVFAPDERTIGWSYASFERTRLKPGDAGEVTRIANDEYVYPDDDRGGFHGECFKSD